MINYLKNISEAVTTIFEGLTITASHLFRKPITIQYPDRTQLPVKEMLPQRYRGLLETDMSICIGCLLCMQACPINCINIEIAKQQTTPLQRLITKFDIDVGLCMFCGFCTEACPTGAIHFTREFEKATQNVDDLTFRFVKDKPVVPYKRI